MYFNTVLAQDGLPLAPDYSNVPAIYTDTFTVDADAGYEQVSETTRIIRDQNGLQNKTVISQYFTSGLQSADVPEAYVIKPDGRHVAVGKDQVTLRDAPGSNGYADFGDNKVIQVLFPDVSVGDKLYARIHITSKAVFPGRFSYFTENAPFGYPYRATTVITAPKTLKLAGLARGAVKLVQKDLGDRTQFTVTETNETYRPDEPNAQCPCDYAGAVSVNNFQGWADVARAYRERAADKVTLTPEVKALSAQLVAGKTGLEAVKAVDLWVRQNVRYVQVYLDAGGYVPHSAGSILSNRYGDCKDYVTLTQTLRKAAGIESEPVLVGTMSRYQQIPLPGPEQFNHAILYVQSLKLYLDPTNRFAPPGDYQQPLAGKPVLLTTSGRLEQFAQASAAQNRTDEVSIFTLKPDGTVEGSVEIRSTGTLSSALRNGLSGAAGEALPQIVQNLLGGVNEPGSGSMTLASNFVQTDGPIISARWSSPKLVQIDDLTSLKMPQGITNSSASGLQRPFLLEQRTTPMVVGASVLYKSLTLNLPDTLKVTRLPKSAKGDTSVFSYSVTYRQQGAQIISEQLLTFKTDIVLAENYVAFREAVQTAVKATQATILLEKK